MLLERAIGIALQAHRGQRDRAGGAYITHPLRMMGRTADPDEQIVSVLHDCVEDGLSNGVTLETIRQAGFPEHILDAVDALTRRTTDAFPSLEQEESYTEFVTRAAENPLARSVKLLDLADNMDLTRLPSIESEDIRRLQRYRRAWKEITGR
jgi:(p)ppGpp synthase/HD superfamily hydrolase